MTTAAAPFKLLVVVAEAVLRDRLIEELRALDITGCTICSVSGWSLDGVNASEWAGASVRLETVVSPAKAEAILQVLEQRYFPSWSLAAWVSDVSVVRSKKYEGP
jgi:nitrogen regulatory protein P-II 2